MRQGDPGGTSYAPDASPPKDGVSIRWKQQLDTEDGYTSHPPPIVANGFVYGVGRKLVCVTTSGDVVFRADRNLPGPPALATARAYQTPTLVYPTWNGAIGLNARGGLAGSGIRVGLTRWQAHRDGNEFETNIINTVQFIPPSPVAADGTVFITDPGTGPGLFAIDASSGQIRWRSHHGHHQSAIRDRPAIRNGMVYVVATVESGYVGLVGYDSKTGEKTFSFSSPDHFFASVTAGPDYLVASSGGDTLVGLDYNGTIRWEYNPEGFQMTRNSFAVGDGVAYAWFKGDHTRLVAVDTTDGSERWRSKRLPEPPSPRFATPAIANGVVYVPVGARGVEEGGGLAAVDARTGRIRWRFSPGGPFSALSPAALVDETLYTLGNGYLYALEER